MEIKWIGSTNYDKGRFGHTPSRVVFHTMDGYLLGCDDWFNRPESYVSAHYGIGKNGEIHQYVAEEDMAWACATGWNDGPHGDTGYYYPTGTELFFDLNPNYYTINIECEGFSGDTPTDDLIRAAHFLAVGIKERWGIEIARTHYKGHSEFNSVTRARCPGFDIQWMLDRINLIITNDAKMQEQSQPSDSDNLKIQIKDLLDKNDQLNQNILGLNTENEKLAKMRLDDQDTIAALQEALKNANLKINSQNTNDFNLLKYIYELLKKVFSRT